MPNKISPTFLHVIHWQVFRDVLTSLFSFFTYSGKCNCFQWYSSD